MNQLHHRRIIIEYYVWEPFMDAVRKEEDNLGLLVKERKLMAHTGYAKTTYEELE